MGAKSSIEWTDASWTPIRARVKEDAADIARARGYASLVQILEARKPNGELRVPPGKIGPHCEHCSPGCENCYSETNNGRCLPANGTGLPFDRRVRDLVDLFLDETILVQPLHWKRPRRIFVCSQTDLFGDFVADEMIDRVCAVMALCPQHTLQVLTKRAERMWEYFWSPDVRYRIAATAEVLGRRLVPRWANHVWKSPSSIWPMYNVWLGVSVEDVERKARMRFLRSTPAAVRFVSFEPLIEELGELDLRGIDLAIWGGESGPGARPCDLEWIRNGMKQAKRDGCLNFVKQVGAHPYPGRLGSGRMPEIAFKHRKGGDPAEWPEDLRVREAPGTKL